ncbi:ankyrin, partial [Coprinopsis marcescibilis]
GVQLESTDNRRWTALMMAAEQGNIDVVRLLVDAGANVDAHDEQGDSALTLAATRGSQSVVKLLLELK